MTIESHKLIKKVFEAAKHELEILPITEQADAYCRLHVFFEDLWIDLIHELDSEKL